MRRLSPPALAATLALASLALLTKPAHGRAPVMQPPPGGGGGGSICYSTTCVEVKEKTDPGGNTYNTCEIVDYSAACACVTDNGKLVGSGSCTYNR